MQIGEIVQTGSSPVVPNSNSNVVIPEVANDPIIYSGTNASVFDMTINTDDGATLQIDSPATFSTYKSETGSSISNLLCHTAVFTPSLITTGQSTAGGTLKISYTGGDGSSYSPTFGCLFQP